MIFSGEPMARNSFLLILLCVVSFGQDVRADGLGAQSLLQGVHADAAVLPRTCQACHRGMQMIATGEEQECLSCHGSSFDRDRMIEGGYLRMGLSVSLDNIAYELNKPYSHPVMRMSGVHRSYEVLPEESQTAPRHAECVDCHNPHLVDRGEPFLGVLGKKVGNLMTEIEHEYQLCYKCHSSSANRLGTSKDKSLEFSLSNKSYHPIEGEGKSTFVVSLIDPYVAKKEREGDVSIITCGDCHGNNDSTGPQGPHGSEYRGLLKHRLEFEDGRVESEFAYALCYSCHRRSSILGNESFAYHSLHIVGNATARLPGTSCLTCHTPHGSTEYPYLIQFNEDIVRANEDGELKFEAEGSSTFRGSCYLSCHGVEHAPKTY